MTSPTHRGRRAKAETTHDHAVVWLGEAIVKDRDLIVEKGANRDTIAERIIDRLARAGLRVVAQPEGKSK